MARMAPAARAATIVAACLALTAGCGLLPAAPGTLDAAGGPCQAAAATSPGPGGTPPLTHAPGPVTFAIGSDDIGWLSPLVAAWNKQHPGTPVQLLYLPPAANDQLAQLVANLQAKSCLYDVIGMDVVWTAQFASSGWVIPLAARQFPLGGFLAPAVATARYQGRLYGVPEYTNADLLYYRTDVIKDPPATWQQLRDDALALARPGQGLYGYAATLAPYEGLTVNFAQAVQSAGGSILSADGARVTVDSPQALTGLNDLVSGIREGWIPQADLGLEETSAQQAFEAGQFLFMSNWPDAYAAMQSAPDSKVAGKFDVAALPGMAPGVPGASSLGGANLAISAYSQHQQAALAFIKYLTDPASERLMFTQGGFPPVLTQLYEDKQLRARYHYLAVLEQSIRTALPRPAITSYDQASLAISSAAHAALTGQQSPRQALADLAAQLARDIGTG